MRYTYKVRELGKDEVQNMYAMSLKKLKGQLDHKKEYAVEYTNKHNNFISTTLKIFSSRFFLQIHNYQI